jgi:hypothetical protein
MRTRKDLVRIKIPSSAFLATSCNILLQDHIRPISRFPAVHQKPGRVKSKLALTKHPRYAIPAEHWPMVMHLVVEQKEPLPTAAAAYGVSHETIRRLIGAATNVHLQQEAQRSHLS